MVVPVEVQPAWGTAQVQIPASQFFGAVAISIVAHAPPMLAETLSPGVMVMQLEATPVRGSGRALLVLVLGLALTQFGYGLVVLP